jgi:uncharacterized metal-binding protein
MVCHAAGINLWRPHRHNLENRHEAIMEAHIIWAIKALLVIIGSWILFIIVISGVVSYLALKGEDLDSKDK